jgi:predicted lactoylglutathione lyase
MRGIVFFRTKKLKVLRKFYTSELGMEVWLEQKDCTILRYGNLLVGFCQRETYEIEGMITFVYDSKSEVDTVYNRIKDQAIDSPRENTKYKIYQFLAKDPEGRTLEFQCFLHSVPFIVN